MTPPREIQLALRPQSRVDVIDVARQLREVAGDALDAFPRAAYCSLHTTAGYLDRGLSARLRHDPAGITPYLDLFQRIFPPNADYDHDKMHLRSELSEEQRAVEPPNGDSHLAYISAGLQNCIVSNNRADSPVIFVDLDGVNGGMQRERKTTVVGFSGEAVVDRFLIEVPVSGHAIDSVNLKAGIGLVDRLEERIRTAGMRKGRVDVVLEPGELHAGLTVNEYETLLMKHDLVDVLRNPLRFMAEKGRHMWEDPRSIPTKTLDYAKYDLVHVLNRMITAFGADESWIESILAKMLGAPASRFLRMKRSLQLLVSDEGGEGNARIIAGQYQSPILVQWKPSPRRARRLVISLVSFE